MLTSGTGSSNSLCNLLPIVDSLIRNPDSAERTAALVVYPMNAIVNSQLRALSDIKQAYM